ncbi:MAG TPA: hypothetical protein PL151_06075 [Phycisphaerae bacterium]|nr:hypothetical protein [Phycisphaerae bacterium]HON65255.1 hypothetical protein [Phycisphaerae bacterium]HOQ84512.1 hypothetical protein [Phycisphaerae bacterium]HPZ99809.1 hypothetical protein [Phycisphaerae bacterium]HQE27306.1 hypothetical protein [Phycisphaerae bacterium]
MRRTSTPKRLADAMRLGVSFSRAGFAVAIAAVAASVFLPALSVQYAAAKRALQKESPSAEVIQDIPDGLPDPHPGP